MWVLHYSGGVDALTQRFNAPQLRAIAEQAQSMARLHTGERQPLAYGDGGVLGNVRYAFSMFGEDFVLEAPESAPAPDTPSPAAPRPVDAGHDEVHLMNMDDAPRPAPKPSTRFEAPDPGACETMRDVRAGVDEIDRLLVALITRRQGYMDAAARIKPSRSVVRDEARIRQVLDNVRAEAERTGLSWAIAEPVWRELMERCIAYEFDVWDRTRE